MATDPVCGMYVDARTTDLTVVRDNRTYYFCSAGCRESFEAPAADLARLRRRLAVAWPCAVLVVVLSYAGPPFGPHVAEYGAAAFATVVQFYPGLPFYQGAVDAVRNRAGNMDLLIAVGTTSAYGYSLAVLLFPAALPPGMYFDASALIVTLILTGNYLERLTRHRAGGALRRLEEELPPFARRLDAGAERRVPVEEVRVGDVLRVLPGERIPVDGIVVSGRSSVSEALLTGESLPEVKRAGAVVRAGTVDGDGPLEVRATAVGSDTLLAGVGALLSEAEMSRVPLQQLANRLAAWFAPSVLVLAVGAAAGWWYATGGRLPAVPVLVFVSVVITACPCAFGLATPAALLVGTGRAADEGVFFKDRDALEGASRVDVVVTDKTGTLTEGRPTVADLAPVDGVAPDDLLRWSAAVERFSTHPFARAVGSAATARGLVVPTATDVVVTPGEGVSGRVEGHAFRVGTPESGTKADRPAPPPRWTSSGWSCARVDRDGVPVGFLAFADPVTAGAADGVAELRADGVEVVMATGDRRAAADAVARAVGISAVHAGLSPKEKVELVRSLQSQGRTVALVGDGINDAPALAVADVGIAIGSGTDVAREAGGIVLVGREFRGVAVALRLARRTVRRVAGNLAWAVGYNAVLLPIAAGALVPVWGLGVYRVLPVAGALAMAISSTTVLLNSLTLRWVALGPGARTGRTARPVPELNRSPGSPPTSPA